MNAPVCHIVNLQRGLGGAEVFTMCFARAVRAAGCRAVLYVHPSAAFWNHLAADGVELVRSATDAEIPGALAAGSWIVTHAPVSAEFVAAARVRHWLTGFCHMPLAGRSAGVLARYHLVYAVSAYVLSTLAPAGVAHAYAEPLYGMAELERGFGPVPGAIRRRPLYSWDQRKVRDRLMALAAPLANVFVPATVFAKRPGVTLGIVSNIGPIKQFDGLFAHLVPHLLQRPQINLEIFGTGSYRSVRDLEVMLAPLKGRVRFWGHQDDPRAIYPQLDYLMSGLPEKEALGLNIIEAQASGTPVLAVDAPPFTETVVHGQTGYLYPDPRIDDGAGFARVLDQALGAARLTPLAAQGHLRQFSRAGFDARVAHLVAQAASRTQGMTRTGAPAWQQAEARPVG